MNCQDFEEILGAYVLDVLSDDERQHAEEHLATCPDCARTVEQLRAVVDLFPLSVPAVDPPPRLKAEIMARILAESTTQVYPAQPAVRPIRRPRWRAALLAATIATLLLLLGGMLIWNISQQREISRLSDQIVTPVTYTLHGAGKATAAIGQITYLPEQGLTILVVRGLPPLSGSEVYQGWLLQGAKPTSIGLFNVQANVATLNFQGNFSAYDAAAISLERGPTASPGAPGGPIVAQGALHT